ncbi:MAG: hypothetical protein IT380_04375 [Myxococcales bacterium]|nr:hypothetical protein [Myxococcales bacterium]
MGWPLIVDATAAELHEVTVEPLGERCVGWCESVIPIGASGAVRAVSPSGVLVSFSGDCDSVLGEQCTFISNRPRKITVTSGERLVTVRTHGSGVVRVEAAGIVCPAESTCSGRAAALAELTAVAEPADPLMDLVLWNTPARCAGVTCTSSVDALFDVTFVPRVRVTLEGEGDTVAGALVNGASVVLPWEALVPRGTEVHILGVAGPDDVVVGFDGLDCAPARRVDECRVSPPHSVNGKVRVQRFYDWVLQLDGALGTDVVARDGGFLVAFKLSTPAGAGPLPSWLPLAVGGSAVAEIALDGGAGRVSASAAGRGLEPPEFIEVPDGRLLVAGPMRNVPIGMAPRSAIRWGTVDASVPERSRPEFALLEFDEAQFQPTSFAVVPASLPDSLVTVTTEGAAALGEGRFGLHFRDSSGTLLDGGYSQGSSGLGTFSGQWASQSYEPVPAFSASFATTSAGPAMLFVAGAPLPAASCAPTSSFRGMPYLARVSLGMACSRLVEAVAEPATVGRFYYGTPLLSNGDSLFFQTSTAFPPTERTELNLHSFDANLNRRWEIPVLPVETRPPAALEGLIPYRVLSSGQTLVGIWSASGGWARGFQSRDGLTVECPPSTGSRPYHVWITTHDSQTGRMTWGTCLAGMVNDVDRFRGLANTALAGQTLLMPLQASSSPPVTSSTSFGTHVLPVPGGLVSYLLALRLPIQ